MKSHGIDFVLQTHWADLPSEVKHQSKRCLLDNLGGLIAGMETPVGKFMSAFAVDQFCGDEATILVTGERASAVGATLANGFAANALDIDDGYRRIKGHPGSCALPPILAATERQAERQAVVSGKDFLTALVIGYEIAIRAGLIRHATYPIYHSSGSWGAIAAAAAAGKVLGLDAAALGHALGAAEYHAPIAPMMKGIDTPSMVKDSIGWGAFVGMSAVLMAERGFTGIESLLNDSPEPEWVTSLGSQYEVLNLYFKPYACCRWSQPAVAGALEISRQESLSPDEIAQINVGTFEAALRLSRKHPENTEEAQYSLVYPLAAALICGELGPAQVTPPAIFEQAILKLADRINVKVRPEYERAFPDKAFADIEVVTLDGRRFKSHRNQAIWEPPDSLPSDVVLEAKFRWLVAPVLGQRQTSALLDMIWSFEQADEARSLIDLCVIKSPNIHPL
ncbi:MAG TPA: MmgE/PrpD family protein [Anaerolineales bacterium]